MGHDSQCKGTRPAGVLDRKALVVIMQILPTLSREKKGYPNIDVTQSVLYIYGLITIFFRYENKV